MQNQLMKIQMAKGDTVFSNSLLAYWWNKIYKARFRLHGYTISIF